MNCFLGDDPARSLVDDYVSELAKLRDEGFRRAWVAQMPWQADVLAVLSIAFREVDTIEVATGVLPIQNQQPMLMAQRALTLSLISGGRFTLGLGMTHRMVTEGMWGIPWDKPVRRLGEYLDGLLPLLDGKDANATGETVTTRGSVRVPGADSPGFTRRQAPILRPSRGRCRRPSRCGCGSGILAARRPAGISCSGHPGPG